MSNITESNCIPGCSLSKLGQCEVCAVQEAKYTCPQCEVKTCSLRCNKIHKTELECSGQRDSTKFIPINKFTNLDLLSDYKLLEEVSRSLESSRKKFGRKWNNSDHLMKVKNFAKTRNIILKYLPYKFERHRINTTYYKFKENVIYWHIEWIFFNAAGLKLFDERISENEKISSILSKYFNVKKEDPSYERLQFYQAAGLYGTKVFQKAEQKRGKKFFEVDMNTTIKETLHNKIVIEYPIFYVVLKDHESAFDIIDSDGEEDNKLLKKAKSGHQVVENIIKKVESENKITKNLLFSAEHSDGDLSSD